MLGINWCNTQVQLCEVNALIQNVSYIQTLENNK